MKPSALALWIVMVVASAVNAQLIYVQVVDRDTNQPLPNVTLIVNSGKGSKTLVTDPAGKCDVTIPQNSRYASISAHLDQYVTMSATWRSFTNDSISSFPSALNLKLEKGTSIGGIVQDDSGQPVSGARIIFNRSPAPAEGEDAPELYVEPMVCNSDAQGKWHYDLAPKNLSDLSVQVTRENFGHDPEFQPAPSSDLLRRQIAILVIPRALSISGRVLDSEGKPIAKAGVERINPQSPSIAGLARTDAKGEFVLKNARIGMNTLVVQAPGHAPDIRAINVGPDSKPVEFKLEDGHLLHGVVTDKEGRPLANAQLNVSEWRGQSSLHWSTKTGPDGAFMWDSAPADEMLMYIGKDGYRDRNNFKMKAGDDAAMVTLLPTLKVHGSVVDAETGKALPRFKVLLGVKDEAGDTIEQMTFEEVLAKKNETSFAREIDDDGLEYVIRIQAEGYASADSRPIKSSETDVSLDFKLKKAQQSTGIVRAPDGKPAANALVLLVLPQKNVSLVNGIANDWSRRQLPNTRTGADGTFSLPMQQGRFKLLVVSDAGYFQGEDNQFTHPRSCFIRGAK